MKEQICADTNTIVSALGPKWKMFNERVPFAPNVPVCDRIEAFASPAMTGILQNFPSVKTVPPKMLWMMIFTAILESSTHPKGEVNAAIAQLEAKYARG